MKKILGLFLMILLSISLFGAASEQPVEVVLMETQYDSMMEYGAILDAYDLGNDNHILECIDFPDFFGGVYLNVDKELVVLVTETSADVIEELVRTTGNEGILYEEVKYSYEDLTSEMEKVNKYMLQYQQSDDKLFNNINMVTLYDKENYIEVKFLNLDEESVALFKERVSASGIFRFVENKHVINNEGPAYVGGDIHDNSVWFSSGFKARWDSGSGYKYGYMTCAHNRSVGDSIYDSDEKLGTIRVRQESGNVDASFFEITEAAVTSTTTVYYDDTYEQTGSSHVIPTTGLTVMKSGKGTGLTTGDVTSPKVTVTVGGIVFTNIAQADYSSAPGDSGSFVGIGPAYGKYITTGIHKGNDGTYAYYVAATYIRSELDIDIIE